MPRSGMFRFCRRKSDMFETNQAQLSSLLPHANTESKENHPSDSGHQEISKGGDASFGPFELYTKQ